MLRFALGACLLVGCRTGLLDGPEAAPGDLAMVAADAAAPPDQAGPVCVASAGPTASLDGTTPLGAFHGRYGWAQFVFECGCRGLQSISITEIDHVPREALSPWASSSSDAAVLSFDLGNVAATGAQTVTVHVRIGAESADAMGTIEITALDVPATQDSHESNGSVEGRLTVGAPGWRIAGTFTAIRCAGFYSACLC